MKKDKYTEDLTINYDLITKFLNHHSHVAMTSYYLKPAIGGCSDTRTSKSADSKFLECTNFASAIREEKTERRESGKKKFKKDKSQKFSNP